MQIAVVGIGQVDSYVVGRTQENLETILPRTRCKLIAESLPIPEEAFRIDRQQYRADIILSEIQSYAEKQKGSDRILGIVDVDIYASGLNFVFGEAECPGKAALISLWRLRPEFYGKATNIDLLVERSTKEAVHELGHALGLKHCPNPFCVMYFSNSIFDTDRKQSLFCNKCHLKAEAIVTRSGKNLERRV
jgi:archaemetzincin